MSTDPEAPPLTEEIRPGTATDPPVGGRGPATVTVDGVEVTVEADATLLDAVEAVDTAESVPALCQYGREDIGPRSECRTCVVGTEAHGLVPACSFPAEDGAVVSTAAPDAAEARSVNLDLVLSDHNLRCTACGKNGRCELQDAAIDQAVEEPRYGVLDDREAYEPIDDTSSFIQIDRNKCILCNRCVEACNDVQVEGVLRMEGKGQDTRIGFQSGAETMEDSTCVSCGHCATVCPTGSLVEKGIEDATTIPIPGFTQKNSVGKVVESTGESKGPMTPKKRAEDDARTDGDDRDDEVRRTDEEVGSGDGDAGSGDDDAGPAVDTHAPGNAWDGDGDGDADGRERDVDADAREGDVDADAWDGGGDWP